MGVPGTLAATRPRGVARESPLKMSRPVSQHAALNTPNSVPSLPMVVALTGEGQAKQIDDVSKRLTAKAALGGAAAEIAKEYGPKLAQAAKAIRDAEKAQADAFKAVSDIDGEVKLAKTRIREQFEAAYGALRALFKSALAAQLGLGEAALETKVFPDSRGVRPLEGLFNA